MEALIVAEKETKLPRRQGSGEADPGLWHHFGTQPRDLASVSSSME